jgi:hypothetical protein
MPLATKNNALILKDGKIAENCNCCGDWYCDVSGGGACCEDGPVGSPPTCSIKAACDCEAIGQSFKGVGTKCETSPCCTKCGSDIGLTWCQSPACIPKFLNFTYSYSEPVRFSADLNGYIGAFSASGSVTLRGALAIQPPCGRYAFSTANPTEAALFNAGAVGFGVDATGQYFVSHRCAIILDGQYSGPQGVRNFFRPSTEPLSQHLNIFFGTDGAFQFAPAASGYCYQSGSAISANNPNATITATVTGAYGAI